MPDTPEDERYIPSIQDYAKAEWMARDLPKREPEFDCEYGCMPMDHGIGIEDELQPDDEPTQDFTILRLGQSSDHDAASCPFGHIDGICAGDTLLGKPQGLWQILPPQPMPEPHGLDSDEQREAVQQYIESKYGFSLTDAQAEIIKHVMKNYETKARGNYTSMVHRETDGSDPLIQEPKDKP